MNDKLKAAGALLSEITSHLELLALKHTTVTNAIKAGEDLVASVGEKLTSAKAELSSIEKTLADKFADAHLRAEQIISDAESKGVKLLDTARVELAQISAEQAAKAAALKLTIDQAGAAKRELDRINAAKAEALKALR